MFRNIKSFTKNILNQTSNKGYKMTKLHYFPNSTGAAPSGVKLCLFGSTSSIGNYIAGTFLSKGTPTVLVHRNSLDPWCPIGDDVLFKQSNPYNSIMPYIMHYDVVNYDFPFTRTWSDIGMRYYQLVSDLTNEWDIEMAIKDCDIVINLIGNKKVIKDDEDYEEANVWIPREIAKVCAKMKNKNVKRFIHFSAAGADPDAISRRLRTKWLGEQEVLKYYPEATIIRPTTIIGTDNSGNFLNQYLHNWHNNNGTVYLLDNGSALRQPVIDLDVCQAVHNAIQMEESKGETYELGGSQVYTIKELMEYFANVLNHRPRFISHSYEDFMRIHLSPNWNFEKINNWLVSRPDYVSELRSDIVVKKRSGIKTFEDLYITPIAGHHVIADLGQWLVENLAVEAQHRDNMDTIDANDDGN